MIPDIEVVGEREVIARLDNFSPKLMQALLFRMNRLVTKLTGRVKETKLSGQVLGVRSGRLRRSVNGTVQQRGSIVTGIGTTPVPYGIGWETGWDGSFGGAKAKAGAKFAIGGGSTFKNGTPRKRAFLVPSLHEMHQAGEIMTELNLAVKDAKQ